ncbi:hypothetical protein [Rhizobium sp. AG207R]|uniref:hypothetical protein n=1 Tax=Rhizobium sp. AG207R TaxID=2802287 RepID=UPI0022AC38D9|nr:hypothetical protein [Rhizobium sp. AG207R]MCZ3377455.1 hypothetical protein [Rhizobium sp. AG207R]
MNILNFRNPPKTAIRADVAAMTADYIARHGVRRFDRGFSQDWTYIQNLMLSYGYVLRTERKFYSLVPVGYRGRRKLVGRDGILAQIDAVLIANGREPFLRRAS